MRFLIILLPFLGITGEIFAQTGTLEGVLIDNETKETVIGAFVTLVETNEVVTTDIDGLYVMRVPAGVYTVEVSSLGYQTLRIENVEIKGGSKTTLNIPLKTESLVLSEIVVTDAKKTNTDVAVVLELKQSRQVINAISSQQITRSLDNNAAQVMQRVPGVTISNNRFVMVRGLPERYNNVIINGVVAPSTEVDKRTFSFDLINSNIIDRLIIYKSGSAENPGDFAGGIIKLFTIDQVDQNYTSLQLGTAYRSGTTMNDYFQSQGSKTDILGFDNSFRTLPGDFPKTNTLIRSNRNDELRTKAAHSLSNNWVAASSMAMPDISMGFRMGRNYNFANGSQLSMINMISVSQEYQTYTREFNRYWEWVDRSEPIMNRFGYVDNLYQKENKVSILSNWNFKLNRNTRIKFKNFFNQIGENETIIRNGYDVIRQGDDLRNYLLGYRQRSIYTGQMEGVHTLNPSNEIQWVAGTSYLGESEPDLRRFRTFRPQTAPEGTNFSMQLPPNSNLFETGRYFGDLNEWSFNHGLNYQHKKKLDSQKEFVVKAGYYGDYRTRSFNSRYFSYLYPGVFNPSIGEELRSLPLNEIFSNENIRTKDGFVLEEGTKASDSYSGTNLVTAGYINAEIPLNRFFISAGVRTEYNVITLDSRNDVEKINVNKQLLSLLPSFNISYSLTSKHQLRGSYSRTVNRPEFREIAPFLFYDYKLEAGRIGNPDLVSAKIDNIDFRYEYYPRSGEIISVGAFYKYFDNPIENTTINTNEVPSFSYGNADWAQNYGVEIEFRKSLKGMTNSSFIDALSFNINASLIRSKVDLGDRPLAEQRVRALQGQSPYVLNAALFYAPASGVNVNVIYNIFGNRIYALGSDNFPTIYELPRNFLDISVSKTFGKFTYKLGVNDVLNARYRFFQDSDRNEKIDDSDDAIISYRTGTRYSFSVSYNF